MMRLGIVSAILPDLSLEEVLGFAAAEGFYEGSLDDRKAALSRSGRFLRNFIS